MLTLELYRHPAVSRPGSSGRRLAPREAALLAYLVVNGPTPRAQAAGLLWPNRDESGARANLRQMLKRLRSDTPDLIQDLDTALELAPGVQVAPPGEGRLLGTLEFDDAPELSAWLEARRDHDAREQCRLGLAQVRSDIDAGRYDAGLLALDRLLTAYPESEEVYRLRMELLHLRGDRSAALAAWDECRLMLRRTFGVAPTEATNSLGQLILNSDACQPRSATALPVALRRPPRLVGRDDELLRLGQALALGHSVLIQGPAGIGKSRLVSRLAEQQRDALVVRCEPGDRLLPGSLLSRCLAAARDRYQPRLPPADRKHVDQLLLLGAAGVGAAVASLAEHRALMASADALLRGCVGSGLSLLAIEDLHYADAASLRALSGILPGWLADGTEAAPLLALSTRMDAASDELSALLALLQQSGRCSGCELRPLGAAAVQALLAAMPIPAEGHEGLGRRLHAQVGGNPAHLLEVLRSMWQQQGDWSDAQPLAVPASLKESLRARLAQLPADALKLAQLAAVAQSSFSLQLAARALGQSPLDLLPALRALESAQVFQNTRFSHDLILECVAESVAPELVPLLHAQIAEHLVAADGHAAGIAHHYDQARQPTLAADWYRRAGDRARKQWQQAEAAQAYEAAAACLEAAGEHAQALLLWQDASRGWLGMSRHEACAHALDRADALARAPRDRVVLMASRMMLMFNSRRSDQCPALARELARLLPAATPRLNDRELAHAQFALAIATPSSPEPLEILQRCEQAAARARQVSPAAAARLLLALGIACNWTGWPARAQRALQAGLALAGDDPLMQTNLHNQLMFAEIFMGRPDLALAHNLACHDLVRECASGPSFWMDATCFSALLLAATGDAAGSRAMQRRAEALLHEQDRPFGEDHAAALAAAHLWRGEREAARRRLYSPALTEGPSARSNLIALLRVRARQHEGLPVTAADLAPAQRLCASRDGLPWLYLQAQRAGWTDELDHAALNALCRELELRQLNGLRRQVEAAAAEAAWREARPHEARAHAARALALADCFDPWCDEAVGVFPRLRRVALALGDTALADTAGLRGAALLEQGLQQLTSPVERDDWLHGNPVHRELAPTA